MFLAFTTENYPSIAFVAYNLKSGWITYFVLYIYVCIFFFEAILLGVIIDAYWVVSKEKIKRERASERANLAMAWNELFVTNDVHTVLQVDTNDERLVELFEYLRPNYTSEERRQMINWLDTDDDGLIDRSEWIVSLLEVLRIGFAEERIFDEPVFDAESSVLLRLRARLYFLKKHSKIIKRSIIGLFDS